VINIHIPKNIIWNIPYFIIYNVWIKKI
jgi:hypothetical protein